MAIKDVITEIKTYFCNWHEDNYAALHKYTDQITNQEPDNLKPATSGGVYDYIQTYTPNYVQTELNNLILPASKVQYTKSNNQKQSVQATLDEFGLKINNVSPKTVQTWHGTPINNGRGYEPTMQGSGKDGLMNWQDKIVLKGLTTWIEGSDGHMSYRINPALRMVYFHYSHNQCDLLKNLKHYEKDFTGILKQCRPVGGVSVATGIPGTIMHIHNEGRLEFHADQPWGRNVNLVANVIWCYATNENDIYTMIGGSNV